MSVLATILTPILLPTRSSSDLAGAWFLQSGIQDETGGVARYYRSDLSQNARVSTEITGYAVSAFIHLYKRSGNGEYLAAAERAGQFLIRSAWSPALATFPFEHSVNGDAPEPLAYFFDCGIIVRGLVMLASASGKSEYRDIAAKCGNSMASDFHGPQGIHPILQLPGKAPLAYGAQWSRQPGCYQLKSAMAWHDLGFQSLYEAAVRSAIAAKDSFLPADTPEKTMDRLHAYCYFLEGLLPLAGRSDCAATLAEGIERVSKYLRSIRPIFERSDVYAQLLRARLFATQHAGVPLNEAAAAEEASRITGFQLENGGYWFGRKGSEIPPFINPVSTAFCMQALDHWEDFQAGKMLDHRTII
jgi:hypothetical protein